MNCLAIAILAASILVSGCATLEHRVWPTLGKEDPLSENHTLYVENGIYPASRLVIQEIKWLPTSEYKPGRVDPLSNSILICLAIVDLPISAVIDTLLLPYDFQEKKERQPSPARDAEAILELNRH
jgi:uncharacterized protein YceK